MQPIPKQLFSLPLTAKSDTVAERLPRRFLEDFNIVSAKLGDVGQEFLLAIATSRPTVPSSRALVRAVMKVDNSRRVVVFSPDIDSGMMRALASEGIAYIKDDSNAFLPFLGMAASPTPATRRPSILSPHAQRMTLNVIAGRWDGLAAGELAEAAGVSRSTVSNCLAEIEAILPSMLVTKWKRRMLGNPGLSKEEMLDIFEPYLASPVRGRKMLSNREGLDVLVGFGALLSGESALSYFSDLAHDRKVIRVAVHRKKVSELIAAMGDAWAEAKWFEEPSLIIEEWAYPIDGYDSISRSSSGFDSLDPLSLYTEMKDAEEDDIRLADAVAQLREKACQ